MLVREAKVQFLEIPGVNDEDTVLEEALTMATSLVFEARVQTGFQLTMNCNVTIDVPSLFDKLLFDPAFQFGEVFLTKDWEGISLRVIDKEKSSVLKTLRTLFETSLIPDADWCSLEMRTQGTC